MPTETSTTETIAIVCHLVSLNFFNLRLWFLLGSLFQISLEVLSLVLFEEFDGFLGFGRSLSEKLNNLDALA